MGQVERLFGDAHLDRISAASAELKAAHLEYIEALTDARRQGFTATEIAKIAGVSRQAVLKATRKMVRTDWDAKLVYFAQPEGGGPIKIGCAKDPDKRIAGFQPWNPYPLRLLGTINGGRPEELRLHRRFKAHRLHGEWFSDVIEADVRALLGVSKQAARKIVGE